MYQPQPVDDFSRLILGIIKLALFGVIYAALMAVGALEFPSLEQGFDVGYVVRLIVALAPLLLLVSALRDLGVR